MESTLEAAGAGAQALDSDTDSPSKRAKATKRKLTAQNKGVKVLNPNDSPKKKRRGVLMPPIVQAQQVEVNLSSVLNCKKVSRLN